MREHDDTAQMLRDAVTHLRLAIELLDCACAPGQIAAHVDLGLNQLEDYLASPQGPLVQRLCCK